MSGVFFLGPQPTFLDPNNQAVHSNATITTSGSSILTGFGAGEVVLIVNLTATPTGTTPTITFTLQQVDPVNQTTVFGSTSSTSSINSISVNVISLQTNGGAVKLSWTVTGAGASFTGLNTSISQRPESPGDLKVGGIAVSSGNPVPISDAGGSLTVDGTVSISTPDRVASGTIAANGQNVTTLALDGVGSFAVQVTGTWAGTIQFEESVDGTNYVSVNARTSNSGVVGVSTTANGVFRVARPGYQFFRCRSSAWTSGTATITIRQAMASGAVILSEALPTGANVIGAVTGSGNFNTVGPGAIGAAVSGNPVRIGLSDGTNTRNVLGDTSGRPIVVGAAASGAAVAGNPVLVGGSDGTNARSLLTATDGTLRVDPTGTTAQPVTDNGGSLTVDGTVTADQGSAAAATAPWAVRQSDGTSFINPALEHVTAGSPHATRLTDGSSFYDARSIRALTNADIVTVEQGAAAAATAPWAIRVSDGTSFVNPALEHISAGSPHATRLTDGSTFYKTNSDTQLPSSLVGGRLDNNIGAWLGSTAPTVGSKTSANSVPVVIASDQGAIPISGTVTATNPSVGTNASAIPTSSTQVGGSDGTNLQAARVFDADTGAGTQFVLGAVLRKSASGGSVEAGTASDPLRTDPTGTTTQPISAASLPLPSGAATEATLALIKAKTDNLDVALSTRAVTGLTDTQLRASAVPISGTITANVGTTNGLALDTTLTSGTQRTKITDGTTDAVVKSGSTAASTADPAVVVAISPNNTVAVTQSGSWANDVSDRASRLVGVVYGSQGQQLKQTVTNFNTQVELSTGATLYDARQIRALTNADVVSAQQSGTWTVTQGTSAAASAPWAVRLSDGAVFYTAPSSAQLPSALVGARLDINNGAWLGSTAPTVGSKTSANSIPVVIASDQGTITVSGTVTATNPSVGTNASAIPTSSTQVGGSDGTNLQAARVFDVDSGAGTQYVLGTILRKSASGGSVEAGTSTDPLRTDPTGTTTQPVSAISLPLPTGAATETTLGTRLADATFTNRINTLGQKTMANSTPVVISSDQSAIPVSGTVTANIGTSGSLALDATLTGGTQRTKITDGTTNAAVKAASTAAVAADPAVVVAISPNNTVAVTQSGSWTNDVSDRAARLVGVVYGSQGQQIKQTATNFNLQAELAVGGTLIDPRSIRALTNVDVVSAQQSGTWTVTSNIGTTNGLALDATLTGGTQTTRITDGTNTATVKAASTAAVAADKAIVVAISPNNSLTVSNPSVSTTGATPPGSATYAGASVTTSAPTYTTGQMSALSLTTAGGLRVDGSGVIQPVSGTITANVGTTNGLALDSTVAASSVVDNAAFTDGVGRVTPSGYIFDEVAGTSLTENDAAAARIDSKRAQIQVIEDGTTRGIRAAVKAPSTAAVSTDPAIVVAVSPNNTIPVSQADSVESTFTAIGLTVTVGNNKSLLSIYNPVGSGVVFKLREFYIRNPRTTAVTGVAGDFRLYRFVSGSAPTGGTSLSAVTHDTNDSLPGGTDIRTGSTISGEESNPLDRIIQSTDEWGPGTLDQEGAQQTIANYLPARSKRDPQIKAFTARPGQGLHMKFATNSSAGEADVIFVFTVQ